MLTASMAAEWATHGIQANAIGPGYIVDRDERGAARRRRRSTTGCVGRTPAGRWGAPEELVGAAVFLASPASDYVNGQIIYVDGGMLAVM